MILLCSHGNDDGRDVHSSDGDSPDRRSPIRNGRPDDYTRHDRSINERAPHTRFSGKHFVGGTCIRHQDAHQAVSNRSVHGGVIFRYNPETSENNSIITLHRTIHTHTHTRTRVPAQIVNKFHDAIILCCTNYYAQVHTYLTYYTPSPVQRRSQSSDLVHLLVCCVLVYNICI